MSVLATTVSLSSLATAQTMPSTAEPSI